MSVVNLDSNDVEIIKKEAAYKGFFKIEKYQLRHKCFSGQWSPVFTRELFARGAAAALLPYDPERQEVVLIEQFRIGALTDVHSPWLIELVAGIIEPNESPEHVVMRECEEESGLTVTNIQPIYQYWVSPGGCSEQIYLFIGHVDASKASGIHGASDENEDIRVQSYPVKQAFEAVKAGKIRNATTIIALQWLELYLQSQKL